MSPTVRGRDRVTYCHISLTVSLLRLTKVSGYATEKWIQTLMTRINKHMRFPVEKRSHRILQHHGKAPTQQEEGRERAALLFSGTPPSRYLLAAQALRRSGL